jgi:hypothetical protein
MQIIRIKKPQKALYLNKVAKNKINDKMFGGLGK